MRAGMSGQDGLPRMVGQFFREGRFVQNRK